MTSEQTREILDQLAGIRRRIDELRHDWDSQSDAAAVIRGLDDQSARAAAYPSIQALLFGAARLIERGDRSGRTPHGEAV